LDTPSYLGSYMIWFGFLACVTYLSALVADSTEHSLSFPKCIP